MKLTRGFIAPLANVMLLALVVAGCSDDGDSDGTGGSSGTGGSGGQTTGGSGGSTGGSGSGGTAGTGGGTGGTGGGSGGSGGSTGGTGGSGGAGGGDGSTMTDATPMSDAMADAGTAADTSAAPVPGNWPATPMEVPGQPKPSYMGEIPIHYGPEVGPKVEMQCPGDPTEGWTEYRDSFTVQRPYNMPINTRFSIIGGIYKFWVFPNDAPHSPTANGRNPRTEARYGGTADVATAKNFSTGNRMWSGDMLIERNAVNSAIFQIHTTADGGGPIGLRVQSNGDIVNNGSLTVVQGSSVPGGTIDKWFNFKASLNAANQEVKIYINNCLKSTYRGPRGDGNNYFKHGVYFCKTSQNGCFSHYKNIHLYKK
jgi:hypothetical protein